MSGFTIQSLQQRFPWIMWPLAAIESALTPRRWAGPSSEAAAAISDALTADTAPLAHRINRAFAWLSTLRASVIRDRPALMRMAWVARKSLWSLVWAVIVVMRLWPRRVAIRHEDTPLRLIPAPESYRDFQSPSLVVPSDVPRAEMSLPGGIIVQLLHLLQDVYPVISSHQPAAPTDPVERLREAYSWIYRLVRTPPAWHSELEEARKRGTLLGLLAAGGPFAKLIERNDGRSNEYVMDLAYLADYPVRPGLARLGCHVRFAGRAGALVPTGIEHRGRRVEPGDTQWPFFERIALCSLATHTTVWRHGMQYHVGGLAPFAVVTHQLPPEHPLRRLLAPHMAETLSTNYHTHLTLRRSGFDVTGFSFPYDTILKYYDDGARYFRIERLDPRVDSSQRGIADNVDYPYLRQSNRYLNLFESYVKEYIDRYYPDEGTLAQDIAAQAWFDALDKQVRHGLRSYVPALTRGTLVKLCALFIYSVTVEHEDNTMWNYAMFLPATVREDGGPESVGQVQSVLNFEMVIGSAANKLTRDSSYVALDSEAAAIMQRLRSRLLALQAEMDREPQRHWMIHPRDLEASVSA